jgi:hypothetical protein
MRSQPVRHRRAALCSVRRRQARPVAAESCDAAQIRTLTPCQADAIRAVMRLFVDDDLSNGIGPAAGMHCAACGAERPAPGFMRYGTHEICNACAIEYEIARASGRTATIGVYLSEHNAGHGA